MRPKSVVVQKELMLSRPDGFFWRKLPPKPDLQPRRIRRISCRGPRWPWLPGCCDNAPMRPVEARLIPIRCFDTMFIRGEIADAVLVSLVVAEIAFAAIMLAGH